MKVIVCPAGGEPREIEVAVMPQVGNILRDGEDHGRVACIVIPEGGGDPRVLTLTIGSPENVVDSWLKGELCGKAEKEEPAADDGAEAGLT